MENNLHSDIQYYNFKQLKMGFPNTHILNVNMFMKTIL